MDCKHQADITRRTGFTASLCAVLVALAAPNAARATVEVNVTRVGFPTIRRGDVIRSGAWVPIILDVALVDQASFDGFARVGQFDTDGDECYDLVSVHLRAETGGTQRFHLYALANPLRNQGRFIVELYTDDGEAVQVLSQGELTYQAEPADKAIEIRDDEILILSLSTGTVGRVQDLVAADQRDLYRQPVCVGHMNPTDLPELWIGLETVNYIVWEDARPEELTERQIGALIEWVRQGGTLLIAASRTAGSVRLTKSVDEVLPVDLGEVAPMENLPYIRKTLLSSDDRARRRREADDPWWDVSFDAPVPVVQCTLRDGAVRIPQNADNESNVVTCRDVGRGRMVFCAVTLADLFSGGGSAIEFFQELFHLSVLKDTEEGYPDPHSLFPHVVSAVGFARSGTIYLLMAAVFSIAYVLVATTGTWMLLGTKGWRHHSWSVFAVVGLAASLLSVIVVNSLRGFGETLHQVSIVDVEAGDAYAYATAFFGIKIGTDRELDLWLPSDPLGATEPGRTDCFLRPIPLGSDPAEAASSFADPEEYRLVAASAVIDDVRIRGTLKRFEGRWAGSLGGTFSGEITVRGLQIQEGSYIINNLGVDLEDCYLLHTTSDLVKGRGFRSQDIYVYPIGPVPGDGNKIAVVSRCYPISEEEGLVQIMEQSRLSNSQNEWGSAFHSVLSDFGSGMGSRRPLVLGQEKKALLLVSTVGEYDPQQDAGLSSSILGLRSWSRDRFRQLDLRERLRRDTVFLIGFADDPGPIRLFRRTSDRAYRILNPDERKSWTMYRIRIPVTLYDAQKKDEEEDELDRRIR